MSYLNLCSIPRHFKVFLKAKLFITIYIFVTRIAFSAKTKVPKRYASGSPSLSDINIIIKMKSLRARIQEETVLTFI